MDSLEDLLRILNKVAHKQLRALSVDVLGALNVVFGAHVGELLSQAVPVQVLLSILRLVLDDVVGHHDAAVAVLLAGLEDLRGLGVADVDAEVVVGFDHALGRALQLQEFLFFVVGCFHLGVIDTINYTLQY